MTGDDEFLVDDVCVECGDRDRVNVEGICEFCVIAARLDLVPWDAAWDADADADADADRG